MRALTLAIAAFSAVLFSQCGKGRCDCVPPPVGKTGRLAYGDSIFYLKMGDYAVRPVNNLPAGTFSVFPDNLTIDKNTGAITVTQKGTDGESQTGLWYKVRFRATNSDLVDSTMVLLSGLTYIDKFYNLSQGDSIIYPVYNGDFSKAIPAGTYGSSAPKELAINPANGQININETWRRGFFNSGTSGTGWKIATVRYAINDNSQQADNKIDLVIYYYTSLASVPSNVSALMQAHQTQTLGLRQLPTIPNTTGAVDNNLPSDLSLSKPRPPCLVIIGH